MNRRKPKSPEAKPLPSKADVLAFIARSSGKVGKREIAREFALSGANRLALKGLLKELEAEGSVDRRRKTLSRSGELPAVLAADILRRDGAGELLAVPAEWDETRGEPPTILISPPARRDNLPAPGIGDRVLIRVEPTGELSGPPYHGRMMKVLSKPAKRALGVFRVAPGGGGRLIPIEKKGQPREIAIPPGVASGGAEDGDLVSVELGRDALAGLRIGRVRERLGSLRSERAISLIAIHTHEIPHVFSPAALAEAEAAKEATLKGREDWRAIPFVTIDPADAKDHDDAVHAEPDRDPANPGGHVLHIAIADVAAYVRPHSTLDREALDRGNSVYFPDRVVPMLPERISNDLCSLKPGVPRAALGLRAVIDARGEKRSHTFHRVLIRSAAKLAYPEAQDAIDRASGKPVPMPDAAAVRSAIRGADELTGPLVEPVLKPLWAAWRLIKQARDAREPLDLDLPERKLVLDATGHVADVIVPVRLEAHRLIEDFMILANVAAAETLEKTKIPLLYRIHDNPSLEKMQGLRDFLDTIGISLPKQGAVRPELFNRILARVKESPNAPLVNEIILRSQAQAEYSPENIGHFGLNLRRYAHFTSPIRRYSDLIVHRGLIRALGLGEDGLPDTTFDQMRAVGEKISGAERRAMAAERETVDRLIAHFLADRIGASFSARIAGVTRVGLFVKLDQTGADGFIPAGSLGDDYFHFDEKAHAMTGRASGESFRLGDNVKVRLLEAAPMAGALRFEMISTGRFVKVTRGKSRLRPVERDDPRGGKHYMTNEEAGPRPRRAGKPAGTGRKRR